MNRRQSLVALSALAGQALFPEVLERFARATAPLAQAPATWQPAIVPARLGGLLAELVDTIIPDTDTPGAKAARVHVFVDLMLAHCVAAPDKDALLQALAAIPEDFVTTTGAGRQAMLRRLDAKALALLKELTILGYFTSEIGATRALAYEPVPGEYRGCIALRPGQRAWATR